MPERKSVYFPHFIFQCFPGPDTWSRTIRRWCGERPLEKEMTSSGESLFVTFRADGQYTEKGFELKYWAVPKGKLQTMVIIEVDKVRAVPKGKLHTMVII